MASVIQCPFCPTNIKVPETALVTTCPKCFNTFSTVLDRDETPNEDDGLDDAQTPESESPGESSVPAWINPWGASGFIFATFALLFASVVGIRWLTLSLDVVGIVAVAVGIGLALKKPKPVDLAWLGVGGFVSLVTLSVTLFAPGMLNRYWEMDARVPRPDPHLLVVVPVNQGSDKGRPLVPEESADASTQAIRQADVFVRLLCVQTGPIKERGEKPLLLIQFRLACTGNEEALVFEGFGRDKHKPALKEASGREHTFLEQRKRKLPAGGIVFLTSEPERVEIIPGRFLDFQLVFDLPPEKSAPWTLELPASAWGRKGMCRFRISGPFEPILPQVKKD